MSKRTFSSQALRLSSPHLTPNQTDAISCPYPHSPVDVNAVDVKVLDEREERLLDIVEGSLLTVILRWEHLGGVGVSCVPSDVVHDCKGGRLFLRKSGGDWRRVLGPKRKHKLRVF